MADASQRQEVASLETKIANREQRSEAKVDEPKESMNPGVEKGRALTTVFDSKDTRYLRHVFRRIAHQPLSLLGDFVLSLFSICFIIFAVVVYIRQNQPVSNPGNQDLLNAAQYVPSVFPILFAAIIAKFLKTIADIKLENGASILSLEYLIHCHTVFNTIVAPIIFRTINILTPLLFLLWALSPLGGQAGLRMISAQNLLTNANHNFTYLAFASTFSHTGADSGLLIPINFLYAATIVAPPKTRNQTYDQFGNVRIPIYESLPFSAGTESDWRSVPANGSFEWSSLTGVPVHSLPSAGVSRFTMNTGYMVTTCNVTGQELANATRQSLREYQGWSGANYALTPGPTDPSTPTNFTFRALDIDEDSPTRMTGKVLTIAECDITMRYVEVQLKCDDSVCQPLAVRPAKTPATHRTNFSASGLNEKQFTPVNGLAQKDNRYLKFYSSFTNATYPTQAGCDETFCPPNGIEAYLADPIDPLSQLTTSRLWEKGNALISDRFTQLINTYWINTIGPYLVTGRFNLTRSETESQQRFDTDSTPGTITTSQRVIVCDLRWFAILIICSSVMLLASVATVVLTICRRGPEVLDKFSSLLRDNRYVNIPQGSSTEDAVDHSIRLGGESVQLVDVHPENEVGHIAITVLDGKRPVERLRAGRLYA